MTRLKLQGERTTLSRTDELFPKSLLEIAAPPEQLYVLGDPTCLQPGLAVIGARKATPYGRTCASHFATLASEKGIVIISGGARGCDSESHKAALACGGKTVVFLGGGIDRYYPAAHGKLFQEVIDKGGALVSEYPWDINPMPYMFRGRNRLIAGLAQAVLIVEAGLPSGTFSTADEALACGKEILVVPGAITSASSRGSNKLLFQGAHPIVDDESFEQVLFDVFGSLMWSESNKKDEERSQEDELLEAVLAQPMTAEEMLVLACNLYGEEAAAANMNATLAQGELAGIVERGANGKWGPRLRD